MLLSSHILYKISHTMPSGADRGASLKWFSFFFRFPPSIFNFHPDSSLVHDSYLTFFFIESCLSLAFNPFHSQKTVLMLHT